MALQDLLAQMVVLVVLEEQTKVSTVVMLAVPAVLVVI
jgi:hypothetical protein